MLIGLDEADVIIKYFNFMQLLVSDCNELILDVSCVITNFTLCACVYKVQITVQITTDNA